MRISELYGDILESEGGLQRMDQKDILESTGVTNIERCYYEWNKHYEGEEPATVPVGEEVLTPEEEKYQEAIGLAEETEYDEEALQQFLTGDWHEEFEEVNDDTPMWLRYKVDGIFVSAFVNQLDQQKVVLPDLEDTSYVGYKNEKELVIEGEANAALGKKMKEGSITVEGTTHSTGADSEGGEIYVEGEISEIGENCGAEVYIWENNEWREVEV